MFKSKKTTASEMFRLLKDKEWLFCDYLTKKSFTNPDLRKRSDVICTKDKQVCNYTISWGCRYGVNAYKTTIK